MIIILSNKEYHVPYGIKLSVLQRLFRMKYPNKCLKTRGVNEDYTIGRV